MDVLSTRLPVVREYLVHNLLDELDRDTRTFVLRSALLGRMNGVVCDALLHRSGSKTVLAGLERRQLVSSADEEGDWYRFHEVLRCHLTTILEEEEGPTRVREDRRRAGAVLEAAGADRDALVAYCAAEDWTAAGRLLGLRRHALAGEPGWWIDYLPPALLEEDPWVMLAAARRHRAGGRCRAAIGLYRRAEDAFGTASPADACRRERASLSTWLGGGPPSAGGWPELLRAATLGQPLAVGRRERDRRDGGAEAALVAGIAALLGGDANLARESLAAVADDASASVRACAHVARGVAAALAEDPQAAALLETAAETAERRQLGWLTDLSRGALALVSDAGEGEQPNQDDDDDGGWACALSALFRSWGALRRGVPAHADLRAAKHAIARVNAPVLDCWIRSLEGLSLAREDARTAKSLARRAEAGARSLGVPGAQALALRALALVHPDEVSSREAVTLAHACGISLRPRTHRAETAPSDAEGSRWPASRLQITCLGGLSVQVDGRPVALAALRPKVRSLLRVLALHCGRPVHREVILEALWPEGDLETGIRNVQVAVSSLRQVLDTAAGGPTVLREGPAYRLVLADEDALDLVALERAVEQARSATAAADATAVRGAARRALGLYAGELLPEEGPADWLCRERERHRALAVEAAVLLAAACANQGDQAAAMRACERALCIDRDSDGAWRALVEFHERAGDTAAAARARRRYTAQLLTELGEAGEQA